jgi:hypothetical protein
MAEAGVGVAGERQQLIARNGAANEGLQDRRGDLGEGLAGKAGDGLGGEPRPRLRHVEAAVPGAAREQGLRQALASGADVPHGGWSSRTGD